ncbi:MAG: site-specific DNA-methyltransferase [Candidatus Rokubacteria bacterium]|nr:site-specific DNA-methyltransferase [Candidatus Rokubacteria bacterium]
MPVALENSDRHAKRSRKRQDAVNSNRRVVGTGQLLSGEIYQHTALPSAHRAPGAGKLSESDSRIQEGVFLEDSLQALRKLPDACVDLVYVDPPFGTGQVRTLNTIRTGSGDRLRKGFGDRVYSYHVTSTLNYRDDLPFDEYLLFLRRHLVETHRVLKGTGSLYLHLDFHSVHYARLVLDEIFGPHRFLNEIVWAYDYGGRPRDRWPRKHDNILWFAKSDEWVFNRDEIDRLPYMAPGLVGPEKASKGKLPTDVWWMTIVPTNSAERTGYPTQKPERLLQRIIMASSKPGDLVLDYFAGTGTTGVVAKRLGRRFLLVDNNPKAVQIAVKRIAELDQRQAHLFTTPS